MSADPAIKPLSALTWELEGKHFTYDDVWTVTHPRIGECCVRVCRPPRPDEGNEGSVLVQFLVNAKKVFAKPKDLHMLTPKRKASLCREEFDSLQMYNFANIGCIGVDTNIGARVMDLSAAAMPAADKFLPGDAVWVTGLVARSDLNGKYVIINQWVPTKQRWQCIPYPWTFDEEFIGVKPTNLTRQAPRSAEAAEDEEES